LDPIVGNKQKGKEFWNKIFEWFVQLHEQEMPNVSIDCDKRTPLSLKTRWRKHISPECREMDAIRKRNPIAPGENDEQYAARCAKCYQDLHSNKDFRFATVLPYLQDVPPFVLVVQQKAMMVLGIPQELQELMDTAAAAVAAAPDNSSNEGGNNTPSSRAVSRNSLAIETVNLPLSRPMGVKQAKKRLNEDISQERSRDKRSKAIRDLNNGMRRIENTLWENSLRSYYSKMLQRADASGNAAEAAKYIHKLSKLDSKWDSDDDDANDGGKDANFDKEDEELQQQDTISSSSSFVASIVL
jgi:hypothetical protein